MLGNIRDHRSDTNCPEVDAVYEPSAYDNAVRADGSRYFDLADVESSTDGFYVSADYDVTVAHAVARAERDWSFSVTVYLYDRGSQPLG